MWFIFFCLFGIAIYVGLLAHTFSGSLRRALGGAIYSRISYVFIASLLVVIPLVAEEIFLWVQKKQMAHNYVATVSARLDGL